MVLSWVRSCVAPPIRSTRRLRGALIFAGRFYVLTTWSSSPKIANKRATSTMTEAARAVVCRGGLEGGADQEIGREQLMELCGE